MFGIFCCGTSPGGTLSNFVVGYVKGDINLSVAMTFTSQIGSIIMMPLWLELYARFSYQYLEHEIFVSDDPNFKPVATKVPLMGVLQALITCFFSIWLGYFMMKKNRHFMTRWRGFLAATGMIFSFSGIAMIFTNKAIYGDFRRIFAKIVPFTLSIGGGFETVF